ncbi:MAG: hypothetical protein M3O30_09730 [Planctomycetota bacterium]|nr:hypothetical protein [Planctomycetota bacterium]
MFNWRIIFTTVLLLATSVSRAPAGTAHVRAELVADVSTIAAGKPFWLGVRLTMDPGWHTYWKNPGDAGAASKVKFDLPAGFVARPLQFPTPYRFDQAGNIVAFGYEDSVMLMAEITPPAQLPAGFTGEFKALVSWLVCSDVCIPGKALLSLSLPSAEAAVSDHRALFDDWKSQVPVNAGSSDEAADAKASGEIKPTGDSDSRVISLEIHWKSAVPEDIQFIPGVLENYNVQNVKVDSTGNSTRITFNAAPLPGKNISPATLDVVVGYKNKDGAHRGIVTTISLPGADGK